jgi:hypothetical protein
MKAKIDGKGSLYLLRAGEWRSSACPKSNIHWSMDNAFSRNCGDWCPLFHEIEPGDENYKNDGYLVTLTCAQNSFMVWSLEIISDERQKSDKAQD